MNPLKAKYKTVRPKTVGSMTRRQRALLAAIVRHGDGGVPNPVTLVGVLGWHNRGVVLSVLYQLEGAGMVVRPSGRRVRWAEGRLTDAGMAAGNRELGRVGDGPLYTVRPHRPRLTHHHGEGTRYRSKVVGASEAPMLKPGRYNTKLGSRVAKGPWRGMPLYSLSLEERVTCPRSCIHFGDCYGNNMHQTNRYDHTDPEFLPVLGHEVADLARQYPRGFVVRLHVLGDFFSMEYIRWWLTAIERHPELRVFGYTAREPGTQMGDLLRSSSQELWDRFAIRTSGVDLSEGCANEDGSGRVGIVCPEQRGLTESCGTCGLCWGTRKNILFMNH